MIDNSWIKLSRKMRNSPMYTDSQAVHLWVHLLLSANHCDNKFLHGETMVSLKAGQLLTGRKALSKKTGINESKIQRLLKLFEIEQQIEQQTYSKYRIISITNYSQYQNSEQLNEQQLNSRRTATEQQLNTNNNSNNSKNENNSNNGAKAPTNKLFKPPDINQINQYLQERNAQHVNGQEFIDHHEARGWVLSNRQKMKDWKAAIRTWITNHGKFNKGNNHAKPKTAVERVEQATRRPIIDIAPH